MSKTKKNTIIVIITMALITIAVVFVAPAVRESSREIPFGQEFDGIEDLARRLDVPLDIFEAYLATIGSDYDDFANHLNVAHMSPEEFTAYMRANTGYSYADYIQVLTLLGNAAPPDEDIFDKIIVGETAGVDVFIDRNSRNNLQESGIRMYPTPSDDTHATQLFHLYMLVQRGNIPLFITGANDVFGNTSIEFTNINIYANYGITRPENDNEMIADMFHVKARSYEIFNSTAMPVMTLRFEDSSRDFTVGVISPGAM